MVGSANLTVTSGGETVSGQIAISLARGLQHLSRCFARLPFLQLGGQGSWEGKAVGWARQLGGQGSWVDKRETAARQPSSST